MGIKNMNTENRNMTGIAEAVAVVGSQSKLAERLGVSQQIVSKWLARGHVPVRRVVEIEAQTGISRHRLVDPRLTDLVDVGAD